METIKVGDKVRVSNNAPRMYRDWDDVDWTKVESYVSFIDDDCATIRYEEGYYDDWEYIPIPLKYLTKVEDEAKEPKFKVGDELVWDKGLIVKVDKILADEKYLVFSRIGNRYTVKESDLEPYTEPTEEKPNVGTITIPVEADLTDSFWAAYTADLAKEVAVKVANKYNDPEQAAEYAVLVAKAVVEGLKGK